MEATRNALGLAGWLAITFVAVWFGTRYMPGVWYSSLNKPSWNPPNAVFGPVWTVLYVMMAVAAWLVWRRAGLHGAGAALGLFLLQLVLNALWSYLFFGLRRPDLALFDILVLFTAILGLTVLFWRVDPRAGALLVPYAAWVGFASFLNFTIWRLNPGR